MNSPGVHESFQCHIPHPHPEGKTPVSSSQLPYVMSFIRLSPRSPPIGSDHFFLALFPRNMMIFWKVVKSRMVLSWYMKPFIAWNHLNPLGCCWSWTCQKHTISWIGVFWRRCCGLSGSIISGWNGCWIWYHRISFRYWLMDHHPSPLAPQEESDKEIPSPRFSSLS